MAAMGSLGSNFPGLGLANMSTMPPSLPVMTGGNSAGMKSGGTVNLRLLISREEVQYLFGTDETLLQLLRQQEELRQPVLLLCRDGELLLQTETLLHQLRSIRDPGSQQRNSILLTRVYN